MIEASPINPMACPESAAKAYQIGAVRVIERIRVCGYAGSRGADFPVEAQRRREVGDDRHSGRPMRWQTDR